MAYLDLQVDWYRECLDKSTTYKWKTIHLTSIHLQSSQFPIFIRGVMMIASSVGGCSCLGNLIMDIQSLPSPVEDVEKIRRLVTNDKLIFFYWTFLLHNQINKRLDKDLISWIDCVVSYRHDLSPLNKR